MTICNCSDVEVSPECIIYSIQHWNSDFPLIFQACFVNLPIEAGVHDCINLEADVLEQDVVEVLSYWTIYDEIYEKFIVRHTDCEHIFHKFLKTYKNMITSDDYLDKLYVLLWTKDWLHGCLNWN